MLISPFTPIFFITRKSDGIESDYIQTFSPKDRILIEVIKMPDEEEGDWLLYSEPGHLLLDVIEYGSWNMNDSTTLDFAVISPSPGIYSIEIGGMVSEPFRVTEDTQELQNTTLIQYSMKNNRQRNDAVFFIDGMQYFFEFRVPGGFKDSNWTFGVDSEQFTTPYADISQLYGLESTQKKFTLGSGIGVPVWFGEMLNRILTCTHVYFDGVKYCRKESNVPEMNVQLEGMNSFVFTQMLQQSVYLDPTIEESNHLIMRRINNNSYRSAIENINRKI